jgi:hypothetical protein
MKLWTGIVTDKVQQSKDFYTGASQKTDRKVR